MLAILTVSGQKAPAPSTTPGAPVAPALLHWREVLPGIWKAVAGRPEKYTLLGAAGAVPDTTDIRDMGAAPFPFKDAPATVVLSDGKTYLRFPLDAKEQLYGFGLNFQTVHQRGKVLDLHVDNFAGRDNGRTHAPTPFYVSSKGYGVFINAARYLEVYAGTAVRRDSPHPPAVKDRNLNKTWSSRPYSDAVEILVPAEGAEVYLLGGPTPLEAVRRYNLLCGGGCLPPRWGLGFMQRLQRLATAEDALREAHDFGDKGYPLDVIGLEPGWQSSSYPCTLRWDSTRFPDPRRFLDGMHAADVRVNLWTNPYVSPTSPIYKALLPYTGSHTVWAGVVADMTLPQARALFFGQLQKDQVYPGVSGYKFDEVDGGDVYLWPDVATWPSGHSAEQMRQTYGLLMQRYSTALYRARNQRTFGLVRASGGGGASYPYVIYNDYYNHEDFITALVNSGFAGVLWTPEVRASKTAEEWLRRVQSNVFSPLAMINAWASGTKPWSFPEVANQVKAMALLRMRMMPYWYTAFARYHFQGVPPFRAMVLEAGFSEGALAMDAAPAAKGAPARGDTALEANPYAEATAREVKDQYMAGDCLLVAPMFTGQTTRKVILPKGRWYDFYTGAYAGDGEVISVTPGLDKIPLFVKEGGMIPMMPPLLHAPAAGQRVDLEIRCYGAQGTGRLYDDDGETYDYTRGLYTWRTLRFSRDAQGRLTGAISGPERGKPNTVGAVTWKDMTGAAGAPVPGGAATRGDGPQAVATADGPHAAATAGRPRPAGDTATPLALVVDTGTALALVIDTLRALTLTEAAWAMTQEPVTVTASHCARSAGGPHDFYSEGDYWWPVPGHPDSPYVQHDGQTNPDNFTKHREAMIRFSRIVGALASAYVLTKDDDYVRAALRHVRAWFVDTATRMNPDLRFAQAIQGRATGRGTGIIDAIQLMEVAQGLRVMAPSGAMDQNTLEGARAWFRDYLHWLTTHPYGLDEMNAANNHGTCWVMQAAVFARFTGEDSMEDFCRDRYEHVLLQKQMAAGGSFPPELKRTKPFGYSIFNLDAMATICQVLDLWQYRTDDGRDIAKGVAFLYPYLADKTKWPYPHDVMHWNDWPVAQPCLLFGALAFHRQDWLRAWARLAHAPTDPEVLRNLPVRHPLIWLDVTENVLGDLRGQNR
ncbi:alginate lyase family protein [Dinghuibacter silviterrae]|uniref:alginate lyase family protein n=1 Tax=Dinghuibacter silviterrae TaxID=1539049 RepID=UPI001FE915BF|nr:alginate lyase family protein [Dinghuibacter silviterrae]